MPFPALGALGAAAGPALTGLKAFLSTPQGQAAALQGIGLAGQGAQSLYNRFYPQKPSAERQAASGLLEQLQQQSQPFQQQSFDPIRQRYMSEFNRSILPQIREQFAGEQSVGSSARNQAIGEAGTDLFERLAALEAQHNVQQQGLGLQHRGQELSRLGQLSGYLGGQQQLGQNAQRMQLERELGLNRQYQSQQGGLQQTIGQLAQQGLLDEKNITEFLRKAGLDEEALKNTPAILSNVLKIIASIYGGPVGAAASGVATAAGQ